MKSLVHTPTSKLSDSLSFYRRLDFDVISDKDMTIVSDGRAVIQINPDRFARPGVKLFSENWSQQLKDLKKVATVVKMEQGFLTCDPSGVWIYLIEKGTPIDYETTESSSSKLGNYAGLSLETIDIKKSTDMWSILGFSLASGSAEESWASCTNEDGMAVTFMKPLNCPHLFFNPSLTYFNGGKNLPVIKNIRKAGIPISEEITGFNNDGVVDNVIIRDPGGYGFFVFND